MKPKKRSRNLKKRNTSVKLPLKKRAYDAASTFKTDDWTSATNGSANSETRNAQQPLRNKGRDAVRNNPYANRIVSAIVNSGVGSGIVPNIRSKSKFQTKRLKDAWKEWGETSLCDVYGRNNFYGLEALVMRSIIESGDVLSLREISPLGMQLRVLECDHLVTSADTLSITKSDQRIQQGIKVDKYGKPISYFVYDVHPGENYGTTSYQEYPADKLDHVYRQDRPGQLRGISWFHPVIRSLEDFNEYQMATIIGRKAAAGIFAVIKQNGQDSTLSSSDLRTKRENMLQLGPATAMFLEQGEDAILQAPPAISGYDEFCRQTLRSICAGVGVPYSSVTGDFSQYNFSSTKMEHGEFRKNIEMWRWQMLIPQFCEPAFKHFLDWCRIAKGIPTEGVTCEWVPPAWPMVDQSKEVPAMVDALRAGLISRPKAILELGYDPEQLDEEIAESNKKLDELGLILDSDPRKITKAGLVQMTPQSNTQGNQSNEKVAASDSGNLSDSKSDK